LLEKSSITSPCVPTPPAPLGSCLEPVAPGYSPTLLWGHVRPFPGDGGPLFGRTLSWNWPIIEFGKNPQPTSWFEREGRVLYTCIFWDPVPLGVSPPRGLRSVFLFIFSGLEPTKGNSSSLVPVEQDIYFLISQDPFKRISCVLGTLNI